MHVLRERVASDDCSSWREAKAGTSDSIKDRLERVILSLKSYQRVPDQVLIKLHCLMYTPVYIQQDVSEYMLRNVWALFEERITSTRKSGLCTLGRGATAKGKGHLDT